MSTLSKIGIVILFIGGVLLGIKYIGIFSNEDEVEQYAKLTPTINFDIHSEQANLPKIIYYEEVEYKFLIKGTILARSKGVIFDYKYIYYPDGTKEESTPFIIRPGGRVVEEIENNENAYLIQLYDPLLLKHRAFSIKLNLEVIRDEIYGGSSSDSHIKNDLISRKGGIQIIALKYVPTLYSNLMNNIIYDILSIGITVLGLLFIIIGVVRSKVDTGASLEEEIALEKELERITYNADHSLTKDLHSRFNTINNRLKRIIKLNKDTRSIDLSEIVEYSKVLVNNSIKLAEYMIGFSTIQEIIDIEKQKNDLDELKVKYTNTTEFTEKTIILTQIKAKERLIYFLNNIESKSEQIENLVDNVDAMLERVLLTFPSIKKEITISQKSSITGLKRQLKNEIEIQEKELEYLDKVTKSSKSKPNKLEGPSSND